MLLYVQSQIGFADLLHGWPSTVGDDIHFLPTKELNFPMHVTSRLLKLSQKDAAKTSGGTACFGPFAACVNFVCHKTFLCIAFITCCHEIHYSLSSGKVGSDSLLEFCSLVWGERCQEIWKREAINQPPIWMVRLGTVFSSHPKRLTKPNQPSKANVPMRQRQCPLLRWPQQSLADRLFHGGGRWPSEKESMAIYLEISYLASKNGLGVTSVFFHKILWSDFMLG